MGAIVRRKTRSQADQDFHHQQSGFMGGLNTDLPAAAIDSTQLPYMENFYPSRGGLTTRTGNLMWSRAGVADTDFSQFRHIALAHNNGWVAGNGYQLLMGRLHTDTGKVTVTDPVSCYNFDQILFHGKHVFSAGQQGMWATNIEEWHNVPPKPYQINSPNPENLMGITFNYFSSGAVRHTYRFTITLVKIIKGEIVSETGAPDAYFELDTDRPLTNTDLLMINETPASMAFMGNFGYNAIRVWRTMDITAIDNETGVEANDPERYYEVGLVPRYVALELTYSETLGDGLLEENIYLADAVAPVYHLPDEVLFSKPVLGHRFQKPIEIVNAILCATPGFMFVAKSNIVEYFSMDTPEHWGKNYPTQFLEFSNTVTAMEYVGGYLIVFTATETHRIAPVAYTDSGNPDYGESIPVIAKDTSSIVSSRLGVLNRRNVSIYKDSSLAVLCSDGSLRVLEVNSGYTADFAKERVSKELSQRNLADTAVSTVRNEVVYLSQGDGVVWRMTISDDWGAGWTMLTGSVFDSGKPFKIFDIPDSEGAVHSVVPVRYEIAETPVDGFLEIEATCKQLPDYDINGHIYDYRLKDYDGDIQPALSFRELRGTSERHTIEHATSSIFLHPITGTDLPANIRLHAEAYVDYQGKSSKPVEKLYAFSGGTNISFMEPVVGNRFRIAVRFDKGGFYIPDISCHFISRDERSLAEILPETDDEKRSQEGLILWLAPSNPLANACSGVAKAPENEGLTKTFAQNGYIVEGFGIAIIP